MGFWDFLRQTPEDTVESLTSEVQGFLTTFSDLSNRCTVLQSQVTDDLANEASMHDEIMTNERIRHNNAKNAIESDLAELSKSIRIATKITTFFED
jgi:hypothetical protein